MEHLYQISAILIIILACYAIGNSAEPETLFTSAENHKFFIQPTKNVGPS